MLLKLPRVKRKTLGTRSLRYAGPNLWKDLPMNIQQAQDIDAFKSMLKLICLNLPMVCNFMFCTMIHYKATSLIRELN